MYFPLSTNVLTSILITLKNIIRFNMATNDDKSSTSASTDPITTTLTGPLVYYGAPYSSIVLN